MSLPPAAEDINSGDEVSVNLPQDQDHDHSSSIPITSSQTPIAVTANTPPNPHSKPCTLCQRPRDVLIRCQIDETKKWHFVCTGKCWQEVAGGKADGGVDHPLYRYGGMWKNKHEAVSAKIKGKAKEENRDRWNGAPGPHRRRGSKAKRKRVGKDSGVKIGDDDRGSDVEVSEVDDDEYDGELLDGFEKEDLREKEHLTKSQV